MNHSSTNPFILQRENTVLFIIDIQQRLLPSLPTGEALVHNTDVFLQAAEAYGLPAVYSEQYPKGLGPTVEPLRSKLQAMGSFRLEKTSYDAAQPDLLDALETIGRRQILVTGMETHICVFQTIRSLLDLDYEVFVPIDAVGSRAKGNWKSGLSLLRDMGAILTNTEAALFDLIQDAKDPHFKALQALIK